jgi:hypothetical protein
MLTPASMLMADPNPIQTNMQLPVQVLPPAGLGSATRGKSQPNHRCRRIRLPQ